jgi:SAM-dependent methyltransferase
VLAVTLLCFVRDKLGALREMARVLAPGGLLVIGDLNRWSLWAARRRMRGWLGSPLWRNSTFLSAPEISSLAKAAGLEVENAAGAVYFPPLEVVARALAPVDRLARQAATFGAAFVAVAARRPSPRQESSERPRVMITSASCETAAQRLRNKTKHGASHERL